MLQMEPGTRTASWELMEWAVMPRCSEYSPTQTASWRRCTGLGLRSGSAARGLCDLGQVSLPLENFVLTHHDGKGQWLLHDVAGGSKGEQVQRDR